MHIVRRFMIALAAASILSCRAGDFTDLWFNPSQSGWGMNVVHQGEIAFITLFVYGPDGQPTWYSASEARVVAYSAGQLPYFSGALYRSTGPWHGGPFDPSQVTRVPVGSISVAPLGKDRVLVTYVAEGRFSEAQLVRASLAVPTSGGYYHATFSLRQAPPGGGAPQVTRYAASVSLSIEDGRAILHADEGSRSCTYSGDYSQAGKLSRVAGEFTCTASADQPARSGAFTLEDLEFTASGMTGSLRTSASDRNEWGSLAGARP